MNAEPETFPTTGFEVLDDDCVELTEIGGGADWCGTMLPGNGIPKFPLPVQRDVFGDKVKLA